MRRLAWLLVVAEAASAQLFDGSRCGQLTCQPEEYCSPETSRCAPCNTVCNKTHHNYDGELCLKECQGYLLDLRYVRQGENTYYVGVERQARAALIVSSVALALLLLTFIIVCRTKLSWRYFKQKFQPSKNRVKHYPTDLTHHNPHAEMPKPKELKLEIRNPEPPKRQLTQPLNVRDLETRTSQTDKSQGATTPKTISTALSNRHPAEDTTLDFSYDNMAMNVTPPEQPASSHKF